MPSAMQLYEQLTHRREDFLDRGRAVAEVTIPNVLPPDGFSSGDDLPTPNQGVGARGVNNLAAKLLLSLFPPNAPFFQLRMDEAEREDIAQSAAQQGADEGTVKNQIDQSFVRIERAVMVEVEIRAMRVELFTALKHLVVAGNALIHVPKDGRLRMHPLDSYVIERDGSGSVQLIVIRELKRATSLDTETRVRLIRQNALSPGVDGEKDVELWTRVERVEGTNKFNYHQELGNGAVLEGSQGSYTEDAPHFIPLRWSHIAKESYGRGIGEEYLGDLVTLDHMSLSMTDGAIAMARLLMLVNPNGSTRAKDLNEAKNGSFVAGRPEDVTALTLDNAPEFAWVAARADTIEKRLEKAFLLSDSVQRNAERVTAEEIRFLAQELEQSLGGVHTVLAVELQLPLVNRLMGVMKARKDLPPFPEDVVRPSIVTGVEALGRGNDAQRIMAAGQTAATVLGPEVHASAIKAPNYIHKIYNSFGIDTSEFLMTAEEMQEANQRDQMFAMIQKMAPQLAAGIVPPAMQAMVAQMGVPGTDIGPTGEEPQAAQE